MGLQQLRGPLVWVSRLLDLVFVFYLLCLGKAWSRDNDLMKLLKTHFGLLSSVQCLAWRDLVISKHAILDGRFKPLKRLLMQISTSSPSPNR